MEDTASKVRSIRSQLIHPRLHHTLGHTTTIHRKLLPLSRGWIIFISSLFHKRPFEVLMSRKTHFKKFAWSEWKRPLIAVSLSFLCNVESSMVTMGEWPYMSTVRHLSTFPWRIFYCIFLLQIDHDVTSVFYGYSTAATKASHAIFAFVFAIWAHKISGIRYAQWEFKIFFKCIINRHNLRIPMLAGRLITLIGCIMYIFVEFISVNRRWWMLVCYLLFGVGFGMKQKISNSWSRVAGTSPLLRSYIARVTTEENRSTGYALQNGAIVLSVVVGPSKFIPSTSWQSTWIYFSCPNSLCWFAISGSRNRIS